EYIDEPVMMLSTSGATTTPYYYHQNSLYSVAALTDATGTVVERYAYSAYGNPLFLDASANPLDPQASTIRNPYLFTARRLDAETGLYYYRARMYDSELGRFVGRDPIGYAAGDRSLYRYVFNTPLVYTDPTGEQTAGGHHPYPLHLGGCMMQNLVYMTKEQHIRAHAFFRKHGWGYGDAGRAAWKGLTEYQQRQMIAASLRHAGVKEDVLCKVLASSMKCAKPGTPTRRIGRCGKVLKCLPMAGVVVCLLLSDDAEGDLIDSLTPGGCSAMGDAYIPAPFYFPQGPEPVSPPYDVPPLAPSWPPMRPAYPVLPPAVAPKYPYTPDPRTPSPPILKHW
ncbi:MAG: RHS repeat-associated core domain-containing protein, partial [Patescibacteria group bacterium]|nr:RHS repeat-associated core domain-containing protein [Patescibacteria group bacterium]